MYLDKELEIETEDLLPSTDEIKSIFDNNNIDIYYVLTNKELGDSDFVLTTNSFIDFCKKNQIKSIFIKDNTLDIEELYITDTDIYEQIGDNKNVHKYLNEFANEWNSILNSIDEKYLDRIGVYMLYTLYQNNMITSIYSNMDIVLEYIYNIECISKDGIKLNYSSRENDIKKAVLLGFIAKNSEKISKLTDSIRTNSKISQELKDELLSDKEFLYCTNKTMRSRYAANLYENANFKLKYHSMFKHQYDIFNAVEIIYGEYKTEIKNQNKKLGDYLDKYKN